MTNTKLFEDFQWREWTYQDSSGRYKPGGWEFVESGGLERHKEELAPKGYSVMGGVWRYLKPERSPFCVGDLVFDFDCEANLNTARRECFDCLSEICECYGIPPEDVEIIFSGFKGFGGRIDTGLFLKSVITEPHEVYREFASGYKVKYPTLDLAMYTSARLWRLPNTKHPKTGLWRINLTLEELNSLTLEEIRTRAREKRETFSGTGDCFSKKLSGELFDLKRRIIRRVIKERREFERCYSRKNGVPALDCLPARYAHLSKGASQGMRNSELCSLVGVLRAMGLSRGEILEEGLEFNRRCSPPESVIKVKGCVNSLLNRT